MYNLSAQAPAPSVSYILSMPNPQTHYFDVEMQVKNSSNIKTLVKMAVWTPGSYLIREYAKNVESTFVRDANGKVIPHRKIAKNVWEVDNDGKDFSFSYSVYAYELSVRNAYIDHEMAYLNGAAVFTYLDECRDTPGTLTIIKPFSWKHITTALLMKAGADNVFQFQNLDELIDSPIQIGNHDLFEFEAAGIPHIVAMVGEATYDQEKIKADFKRICEAAFKVVGQMPCKKYTFIIHNMSSGGGGLEHAHSTTVQTSANTYQNEQAYINFLSLIAHEYFHLWNIKRIRPIGLDRFDYEKENYTHMLWFAEGGTSYYDDFINYRSGLMSEERFFQVTASNIMAAVNTPGGSIQSLAESSLDAWIKYYRQNENSINSMSNYYSKGSAINLLLDLEIIIATQGKKNLDHVMRALYDEYYLKNNRGFTDEEFTAVCSKVAGKDLAPFFQKYVYGTEEPDFETALSAIGMLLTDNNATKKTAWMGVNTRAESGRSRVTAVIRDSPAWKSGIHVGDIISYVNGQPVANDLNSVVTAFSVGTQVDVSVIRGRTGKNENVKLTLVNDPNKLYQLELNKKATKAQASLRNAWLRK
jgi:predicted metalloprotease with PDZ domain